MNVKDKIIRAKIQLQRKNPFWAYLSLYLKIEEDTKGKLPKYAGMGVNVKGELLYNKKFIETISNEELEGVIAHELNHLVFNHLLRLGNRNRKYWNIATDIVINTLLINNNFKLPSGALIPDYENKIKIFGQKIVDCDKKIAEEVYDELVKQEEQQSNSYEEGEDNEGEEGEGRGNDEGNDEYVDGRFDEHFEEKDMSEKEKRELEKEWINRLHEALSVSKMKGDVPLGMERLIEKLHKEKIDWKALLYQFITKQIPYNSTWAKPHKKSISVGTYMPDTLKEKIDITAIVDVSGSIGQKELTDFLSEIIGIAKAFREKLKITLLTHETEVNNKYVVDNGNIEKIKKLKIIGGGGTAHDKVFEYIQNNIKDCKCAVFLTDGYSNLDEIYFDKYFFEKIFVISENGDDSQLKNKNCHIIKLKE